MQRVRGRREILARLRSIEGHLRALRQMVESGQPDSAILHQVLAAKGSVQSVGALILRVHVLNCVPRDLLENRPDTVPRMLHAVSALTRPG